MEIQDIVTTSQGLMNEARSARNSGDEDGCKKALCKLRSFLEEVGPDNLAENPTPEKEVTP